MNSQSLNYLYTLLGTVAVMSILVMDEEVLVLLCWVTFVGLAYTYGASAVNAMFDERRAKYSEDILSSYNLQEKALKVHNAGGVGDEYAVEAAVLPARLSVSELGEPSSGYGRNCAA